MNDRPATFDEFIAWYRDLPPEVQEQRRVQRDIELRETMDQRNREHRIAMAKKLSNLGPRFAERTLDAFDTEYGDPQALAIAREIAADPCRRGAWFFGGKGAGKTHLAGGIVNAATDRGIPAAFVSVNALIDQLNAAYDRNGHVRVNQVDVIRWLASIEVLVLDDIDKVEFTSSTSRRFYGIVNQRYENSRVLHKKAVIITSNLGPADVAIIWRKKGLDHQIGDAIMDRFRELCGQFVFVEGDSYRARLMEQAQ